MKALGYAVSLAVVVLCVSTSWAALDAKTSFAEVKSLTGNWEGKASTGKAVDVSFKLTAGGSAIMSEIKGDDGKEDMITMFHMDGNRLLMTHYCGAGNQPRMTAIASDDGKTITFNFLDGTNLDGPSAGHMSKLVLTMLDSDHHTEEWVYTGGGKDMTELFDLKRAK